jgi:hypothetical protein
VLFEVGPQFGVDLSFVELAGAVPHGGTRNTKPSASFLGHFVHGLADFIRWKPVVRAFSGLERSGRNAWDGEDSHTSQALAAGVWGSAWEWIVKDNVAYEIRRSAPVVLARL